MPTKTATKKPTKTTTNLVYQSNPFSLSFDKFGQFFEKNLWWAIVLIIVPIFSFFLQMLGAAIDTSSDNVHALSSSNSEVAPWLAVVAAFLVLFSALFAAVIIIASIAIGTFITGLFAYVALENNAGRSATFGKAVDAVVSRFWRLFLAQLLAFVKILGWSLLFVVPGIIAIFRYALLPYVILDEPASKKGVKTSHERVKTLVNGRKREVFGIATVATIIPIVGGINQLVGNAALYRQLQVYSNKKLQKPPIHWLNYFGFIILGLYILLLLGIASIFILADPSVMN